MWLNVTPSKQLKRNNDTDHRKAISEELAAKNSEFVEYIATLPGGVRFTKCKPGAAIGSSEDFVDKVNRH